MIRFIHAADFHLDSAFAALRPQEAAQRRRESRELPRRLAKYVNEEGIELVLLAGDLFDSDRSFRDTAEDLSAALGQMQARVFIAPGNHDWYGPGSPYQTVPWPENVHIFREGRMCAVPWEEKGAVIHGAAFTAPDQSGSFLAGFAAPADGRIHMGLLHGELDAPGSRYDPIERQAAADSGLAYLALGHIHKRTEPLRLGKTVCAWPGCPQGRGFDELGEKGFYRGTVSDEGAVELTFVPFAQRRYEILRVDVTGQSLREAVAAAVPEGTEADIFRIVLTGERGEEDAGLEALEEALSRRFYALELRDETHLPEDLWERAEEDSLRGLFLQALRQQLSQARDDAQRQRITRAARLGLAALEHRDLG